MATYADLYNLRFDSALRNRVEIATLIAAEKLRVKQGATSAELALARAIFHDPVGMTAQIYVALLATNAAATIVQITGASDATIQTAVDAAAALFVGSV
jgi:hypothetical protein